MQYLIGVDLGTSGTKTVLFDENGKNIASATVEYPMYQPKNGWSEQDPSDWWNATQKTMKSVIEKSGVNPKDIKGVGISGQMHGLVMLDEKGKVLRRSIIWNDGRTGAECEEITNKVGKEKLIAITANPALTGFTAGKILWVRKNEPDIYAKCKHILLPKDYVRYELTGEYATEVSDASGMNLLDVPNRCWSKEILNILEIDESLMAKMYESYEITGYVTKAAAELTGLAEGTPVVGGAGDNAAAAIGTGVVSTGKAFTTIGTSGVIFAHSDYVKIDPQGRIHSFCSAVPGKWTVMSCTLAAGLSYRWLRDNVCTVEMAEAEKLGVDPYVVMNREAEESPIGANKLLFLPYLMGERSPLLDEKARGVFFGLSAMHTRKDLSRAVLEGVSYSQKQCMDVFEELNIEVNDMMGCGGGARSPLWRQMLADMYNCPVKTAEVFNEGPALGVAILAGVGTGVFESVEQACEKIIKIDNTQMPIAENTKAYTPYYNLYKSLYPTLKDSFAKLSELN